MKFYIVYDQELVWSVAFFFCRRLIVPWPSVSVCLAFGTFCSVCSSHMVVRALGLTLPSDIFGQYMCCRPMCSQCVHRSVSVVLWIEL